MSNRKPSTFILRNVPQGRVLPVTADQRAQARQQDVADRWARAIKATNPK